MVYVLCASTLSSSLSDSLAVAPTEVERCGHGCGRGRLTRITGVLKQTSRFRLGRDEGRKFDIDSPPTPMLAIRLPSPPFLLSLYPILLFYLISLSTGGRCPNRECETSSSVRPSPLSAKKRACPPCRIARGQSGSEVDAQSGSDEQRPSVPDGPEGGRRSAELA